jgi:hypothetical protein
MNAMDEVLRSVLEAAALVRATVPKRMELWVTRAITDDHHGARVDLPERILIFVSPVAMGSIKSSVPTSRDPMLTYAGAIIRDFDTLPRDAQFSLAMEVESVSPALAAKLAVRAVTA